MQTLRWMAGACALLALSAHPADAQPKSGKITYEVIQKIDLSQMRMVINGQEVRPGSAEAPADMPDTRSFTQYFVFANGFGKEEQDRNAGGGITIRRFGPEGGPGPEGAGGPGGPPPGAGGPEGRGNRNVNVRPIERQVYFDLAAQKSIEVMTVRKDSTTNVYQAEMPLKRATGWQESDKTKKIAGYICHKATTPWRNATYTIWYTTDLPYTYSPVASLTPEKGVVLQIESDNESYKATKVAEQDVKESDVMPPKNAQVVSAEELNDIRRKVMADMRQQMMNRFQNR